MQWKDLLSLYDTDQLQCCPDLLLLVLEAMPAYLSQVVMGSQSSTVGSVRRSKRGCLLKESPSYAALTRLPEEHGRSLIPTKAAAMLS
jgi:hypothetical protein